MAIGAQEHTLLQLLLNLAPAAGISLARDAKVFARGVQVVELQGFYTPIVPTDLTTAAFISNRLPA